MHPKIRELDSLLRRLERPGGVHARLRISTGCGPLDAALPGRGLLRGSLVEWLGDGPGCGAGMLALRAASEACREGGALGRSRTAIQQMRGRRGRRGGGGIRK